MLKRCFSCVLFVLSSMAYGQQFSGNGWFLSPRDTLRILVVFVEIDYDEMPELDELPNGSPTWRVGELPDYKAEIFDPGANSAGLGKVSTYYRDMSLGHLAVYGDYYPKLVQIKYSDMRVAGQTAMLRAVAEQLNEEEVFRSAAGLGQEDFDLWEKSPGVGKPKSRRAGDFKGFDHVMILTRNYDRFPKENGMASGSSLGNVRGKPTDTYSVFSGGHGAPSTVLRHEINHLLIGGNNFHCGGGNNWRYRAYFPFVQGGWCMMGGANSSFLTCTGWDRYWLNWPHPEADFLIAARDEAGQIQSTDLDRSLGAKRFVLRDFVTTGDAIRIKLPYLPAAEFQQWIWLENHKTAHSGGSMYDVLQYEHYDCIEPSRAGLHAYIQVDANNRSGNNIYGEVNSDYLRQLPADGNHDVQWEAAGRDLGYCVNNAPYVPFYRLPELANPLTGNHALEQYFFDQGEGDALNQDAIRVPYTYRHDGTYQRIAMLGHARTAFRKGENEILGIGTNPSTANMLSFLNSRKPTKPNASANQTIHISGIRIAIIDTLHGSDLLVEVRFDDHLIDQPTRWCAPEIQLHNHREGADLTIRSSLQLDLGETMTRFDQPIYNKGRKHYTDPTKMTVSDSAAVLVEGGLIIDGKSALYFEAGTTLEVVASGKIEIRSGIVSILSGAEVSVKGKIVIDKGATLRCFDQETYRAIRKKVKGKKRLVSGDISW